jgi:DNA (cytosine-5)-methyltransferase 3A
MKQEYQDVISKHLGIQPIKLNSTLTSAQNRVRLYWTNFKITEPKDQGIKLEDILEDTEMIGPSAIRGRYLNKATILGRRVNERGVRDDYNKQVPITQCLEVRATNRDKSNCLTTVAKDTVLTTMPIGRHPDAFNKKLPYRNYTKVERARLMNLPDTYFDSVSLNQAVKISGNGWDVGMIKHILTLINLKTQSARTMQR